jgi:hypothetical protein
VIVPKVLDGSILEPVPYSEDDVKDGSVYQVYVPPVPEAVIAAIVQFEQYVVSELTKGAAGMVSCAAILNKALTEEVHVPLLAVTE